MYVVKFGLDRAMYTFFGNHNVHSAAEKDYYPYPGAMYTFKEKSRRYVLEKSLSGRYVQKCTQRPDKDFRKITAICTISFCTYRRYLGSFREVLYARRYVQKRTQRHLGCLYNAIRCIIVLFNDCTFGTFFQHYYHLYQILPRYLYRFYILMMSFDGYITMGFCTF